MLNDEIHLDNLEATNAVLRARLALDAGRMGSWRYDVESDQIHGDPFTAELFGLSPTLSSWPRDLIFENIHRDDQPRIQSLIKAAIEGDDIYEAEFRMVLKNPQTHQPEVRWIHNRARVTQRSEAGLALEFIGICWDITEQKQQDDLLLALAGDMDHRAKNAFAIIRAMVNIGRRESQDVGSFAETLRGHIEAMASAHALAAKEARAAKTPQTRVPILDLIEMTLETYQLEQPADRLAITGDRTLSIAPEFAASLAMIMQGLAANAKKHGALGPQQGKLDIKLSRSNASLCKLDWSETFADHLTHPLETIPNGFGSILLIHCVATMRGEINRRLTPNGLHVEVLIPI